jgi:hypothetical protein
MHQRFRRRFVFPHHLLIHRHLRRSGDLTEEHVPIWQQPAILRRLRRKLPFDLALGRENGHAVAFVVGEQNAVRNGCVCSVQSGKWEHVCEME